MSGPLSIVAIGHVHAESLLPLTELFAPVEQLVLDIPAHAALEPHRAELNRAVDAASGDWILIVREHESVTQPLAAEIAAAAVAAPRAWGMRIRSVAYYAGAPLLLGPAAAGEVRLFHRRHLLRRGEINVQGTVVRLEEVFRSITFATPQEHWSYLSEHASRSVAPRRLLSFLRNAIGSAVTDRNTLRYLWIEAAFESRPPAEIVGG